MRGRSKVVIIFFLAGIFVGSKLEGNFNVQDRLIGVVGLPNTKNILKKWDDHENLRGSAQVSNLGTALTTQIPSSVSSMAIKAIKQDNQHIPSGANALPIESTKLSIENGDKAKLFRDSLHANAVSYMKGPVDLDSKRILVGAWIYLDNVDDENDMRTIFTNKAPGCEQTPEQFGLSLYVNAWSTHDHKLYTEFGSSSQGCNKLGTDSFQLELKQWYHVAVYLGISKASLYVDGKLISTSSTIDSHEVQVNRPIVVGQYEGGLYPFNGNISYLSIINLNHYHIDNEDQFEMKVTQLVQTVMDAPTLVGLDAKAYDEMGLVALYPFSDASHEIPKSQAMEVVGRIKKGNKEHYGQYFFPGNGGERDDTIVYVTLGRYISGVKMKLIDGVGAGRFVTPDMIEDAQIIRLENKERVKEGMIHAWKNYRRYAWGRDELKPVSKSGNDNWGGMGVTLVDALSTLWIMGMKEEFYEARDWVRDHMTFSHANTVSVFETTIRALGGLLSAYDFSKDKAFLDKAEQLGDLLMPAFDTPTGIPRGQVNFKSRAGVSGWGGDSAVLAELGSLQIEFRYLAYHTKKIEFETKVMKPFQVLNRHPPESGLYPIRIHIRDGSFADSTVTFGALGDSFYEYLLKTWIQGGRKEQWLRDMYNRGMDGVMNHILATSSKTGLLFLGDWNGRTLGRKMDHLACFLPGTLALGAYTNLEGIESQRSQRDLSVAKALMYTCYQMYRRTATHISPEYVEFPVNGDMEVPGNVAFYILRPEVAESLFYLSHITKDPIYSEWAYDLWEAIDQYCRVDGGYGALRDVRNVKSGVDDRMESFFYAELVKYLYMAIDPELQTDFLEYVYNTEAHPMSVLGSDHQPVMS